MIDCVVASKNRWNYDCKYKKKLTWKCGVCNRGNIYVIKGEHQGHELMTKECKVCKAKITLVEISR